LERIVNRGPDFRPDHERKSSGGSNHAQVVFLKGGHFPAVIGFQFQCHKMTPNTKQKVRRPADTFLLNLYAP
jgi:hypothetical protein